MNNDQRTTWGGAVGSIGGAVATASLSIMLGVATVGLQVPWWVVQTCWGTFMLGSIIGGAGKAYAFYFANKKDKLP